MPETSGLCSSFCYVEKTQSNEQGLARRLSTRVALVATFCHKSENFNSQFTEEKGDIQGAAKKLGPTILPQTKPTRKLAGQVSLLPKHREDTPNAKKN